MRVASFFIGLYSLGVPLTPPLPHKSTRRFVRVASSRGPLRSRPPVALREKSERHSVTKPFLPLTQKKKFHKLIVSITLYLYVQGPKTIDTIQSGKFQLLHTKPPLKNCTHDSVSSHFILSRIFWIHCLSYWLNSYVFKKRRPTTRAKREVLFLGYVRSILYFLTYVFSQPSKSVIPISSWHF